MSMRLESVKLALPSRRLSNEDVVALVRQHSERTYVGDLNEALDKIRFLLQLSGAEFRYWLGEGETPLGHISRAVNEALTEAHCRREDIELLIYVGVDRGFIEPANAYFVAHALGMDRVHCFDLLDACNSWSRALHLVYALFQAGAYKRAMLINAEFGMFEGGAIYPDLFTLRSIEEIEWSFGGYTLGEGAAATILVHDPEREWEFRFSSRPDLADLCAVPLEGYERYCQPSSRIGRNGVRRFTSFGHEMFSEGAKEAIELFQQLQAPLDEVRVIFPHAASKKAWDDGAASLGLQHLLYNIYPRCGNLISASVPAGMALAIEEGRIERGDRIVCCVGSAGMSFAAYSFVY